MRPALGCAVLAAAMLSGCATRVSTPAPTAPKPAQPPAVRPAPPLARPPADWRNAPQTPGTWRWRMEGERSVAAYGPYGGTPVASLTCEPATRVLILWRNWSVTGPTPATVTTTGSRGMLTMTSDGAGGAQASIAPGDRLADAIAFSRGRFMLELPGAAPLYLPAWPELSRVIEDCR